MGFSSTQAWKRQQLAEVAIALPATLRFVPVDFEREPLAERLSAGGLDPAH
jgi:O-methyltransferase involved in polyketide biosynthesis